MKEIQLNNGFVSLVDDEDFDFLNQWKWYAIKNRNTYYVRTAIYPKGMKGKQIILMIHRLIMNAPNGMQIDHINHNGLDNRKDNLRVCTHHENQINRLKRSNTGFTGVRKNGNRFTAMIYKNKKVTYLGTFNTAIEAGIAYNDLAKKLSKI